MSLSALSARLKMTARAKGCKANPADRRAPFDHLVVAAAWRSLRLDGWQEIAPPPAAPGTCALERRYSSSSPAS
jgi:hypothetical protein